MFNLSLNATDSCPDGSIMLLFPTITVKHYRISLLLSFLTAARFLTLFYLRTFSFKKHGEALAVDFAILISLLVQNPLHPVNDTWPVTTVLVIIALAATQIRYNEFLGEQKTKTLVTALALYLASTASLPTLHTISLIGATTQFIRSPAGLKELLREPRLICGPIHPIMVAATGRYIALPLTLIDTMYLLAIFCVTVAAGVLRPDNTQVLNLLPHALKEPFRNSSKRRGTHGLLMFLSVVMMTFNSFLHPGIGWLHTVALNGLFALVVIMYAILKFWK